jgi:hypothetical protein
MRAFRKLARDEYARAIAICEPTASGGYRFTVDCTTYELTPAEGKTVRKWLEEGK